MLESLKGSNKPFLYTNGTLSLRPNKVANEQDGIDEDSKILRAVTEQVALSYKDKGVSARIVRLPFSVHGKGDKAFVPILMNIAKAAGKSGYVGQGTNALGGCTSFGYGSSVQTCFRERKNRTSVSLRW
ncbi:YLL056C-like protein [Saccharomyces cerevisiae AWRI796]|nr:YLL056C-like protein [Saccharomyces cerevisiae AWRI796]